MFQLHAISPGNETPEIFTEKALQVYDIVDFIHLRERNWTVKQFLSVIDQIKRHDESLSKIIVNDRIDIAQVSGIQKVHLPSHGFEPTEVNINYPTLNFGCSVHNMKTAKIKERQGARYLIYGHLYQTNSKKGLKPRGLNILAEMIETVDIPVIAIGGITPERIKAVQQAGANGVAIMSGIFASNHCRDRALQYKIKIDELLKEDKSGPYN